MYGVSPADRVRFPAQSKICRSTDQTVVGRTKMFSKVATTLIFYSPQKLFTRRYCTRQLKDFGVVVLYTKNPHPFFLRLRVRVSYTHNATARKRLHDETQTRLYYHDRTHESDPRIIILCSKIEEYNGDTSVFFRKIFITYNARYNGARRMRLNFESYSTRQYAFDPSLSAHALVRPVFLVRLTDRRHSRVVVLFCFFLVVLRTRT